MEEIDEDLNLIGDVKLDELDQLLPLDSFCRVYWLIRKHVEPRLEVSLAKLKKRRRRRLAQLDLESYRHIVMKMDNKEM